MRFIIRRPPAILHVVRKSCELDRSGGRVDDPDIIAHIVQRPRLRRNRDFRLRQQVALHRVMIPLLLHDGDHAIARCRIGDLAFLDHVEQPQYLIRRGDAESKLFLLVGERPVERYKDFLENLGIREAQRGHPRIDVGDSDLIEHQVSRRVIAFDNHQRDRVLERQLHPPLHVLQDARPLHTIPRRKRNGIIEVQLALFDLQEGLSHHRNLNGRSRLDTLIPIDRDDLPRCKIARRERDVAMELRGDRAQIGIEISRRGRLRVKSRGYGQNPESAKSLHRIKFHGYIPTLIFMIM